jgi:hypothetical protein
MASLAEVAAFNGLIYLVIWLGQKLPWRPPVLVAGLAMISLCVLSNRRHGDSREKIGLDPRWIGPASRSVLLALGLPLAFMGVLALRSHLQTPIPLGKILFGVLGYPLWAFAQQYTLLGFQANRLREGLGDRPWSISLLGGTLFSLIHAPNLLLMGVCFIGGVTFTKIFLKTPHLVPAALAHAAAGFFLSVILYAKYNAMMVGPAYWKYADRLGPHP